MTMAYPSLEIAEDMPLEFAVRLYRDLPAPKTDEEKDVLERIAVQVEGCGLLNVDGTLKGDAHDAR